MKHFFVAAAPKLLVNQIRTLMACRTIPYFKFCKFGPRTIFFDLEKVEHALARFEIHAVGENSANQRCTMTIMRSAAGEFAGKPSNLSTNGRRTNYR